ncbi:hypothetical protein O2K51_11915 [Apibacter raozihei]|uniref:hypothetical protein n=1 Tax=Apibacter raozihei TaxID=2500547 RepID=UPI000FE3341B|nr:hypothetical protein [Apibacter raozihei]
MKKLALILTIALTHAINAQVGIGTDIPDTKSILDITSVDKGILIPRMTEVQRDKIKPEDAQQALMIYNTSEDCFNYWNLIENKWASICGALGKAQLSCVSYKVAGTFVEGLELTDSNRIYLTLNVTKPGSYSISGITKNGYSFYGSGTFLTAGQNTIKLEGQGTPLKAQVDAVTISINGVEDTTVCTPSVKVNSSYSNYSISCKNSVVNGVYKQGTSLDGAGGTHYVTISLNATSRGSWNIKSNTVDGIYFEGSGEITAVGAQTVTIYGYGTPTSVSNKTLTLTATSSLGESTCQITVVVVIPKKNILHIGSVNSTPGYIAQPGSGAYKMIMAPVNFGQTETSTVKAEGFNSQVIVGVPNQLMIDAINAKPDIVLIGYYFDWNAGLSTQFISAVVNYVNNNGVLMIMSQNSTDESFLKALYGDTNISTSLIDDPYRWVYPIASMQDDIANGPFGDLRGKYWGGDVGDTRVVKGIPSYVISYSTGNTNRAGYLSFFRDPNLNFIWNGEGGFLANPSGCTGDGCGAAAATTYPFAIDANLKPIPRVNWGSGVNTGTVYNSALFANMMAWALNQAEFNGINTK